MRFSLAGFTVAALTACSLTGAPALAQTTSGQISGRVVEPDGQAIANAEVTLTNQLTKDQRVQRTETSGDFVFVSVQPGTFSISIAAPGFRTITKQDLMLTASERLSAGTLRMEIGPAIEQITVRAEVTPLQTDSGERSALLDEKPLRHRVLHPRHASGHHPQYRRLRRDRWWRCGQGLLVGNPTLSPGSRTFDRYINTDAVTAPLRNAMGSNGQFANMVGNAGRVVFRGPGTNNWDMALFKNIPIKERVTFQLRCEFYNIFNHVSFTGVDNVAQFRYDSTGTPGKQQSDTFGQLTGELGPRQIQLAGRITF